MSADCISNVCCYALLEATKRLTHATAQEGSPGFLLSLSVLMELQSPRTWSPGEAPVTSLYLVATVQIASGINRLDCLSPTPATSLRHHHVVPALSLPWGQSKAPSQAWMPRRTESYLDLSGCGLSPSPGKSALGGCLRNSSTKAGGWNLRLGCKTPGFWDPVTLACQGGEVSQAAWSPAGEGWGLTL